MTPPSEPRLSDDDVRLWSMWRQTFALRARSREFLLRVDAAKRIAARELEHSASPMVGWSAGKDSTALAHLVTVGLGAKHVVLMSEKDDLDYPGEEAYVTDLAAEWGARLNIVRPDVSPAEWIASRAAFMSAGEDIHSRSAGLSKACFYGVVEHANAGNDLLLLGLRADESGRRSNLLRRKGSTYTLKSGARRAHPLAEWSGLDVFAYLEAAGVEPLHVYKCIALMHRHQPWMIRKSWWLPGANAGKSGHMTWLRRYYPSLYERAKAWFPDTLSYS